MGKTIDKIMDICGAIILITVTIGIVFAIFKIIQLGL